MFHSRLKLKGYLLFCFVICQKYIFICIGWQNTCVVKFSVTDMYVLLNVGSEVMVHIRSQVDTAHFAQNDSCNSTLKASTLYVKHPI